MKKCFSLSVLSIMLLSTPLFAGAVADKEFAKVPLRLDNKIETTTKGVKPNVMFYIDDSGSMGELPSLSDSDNCKDGRVAGPGTPNYDGTYNFTAFCPSNDPPSPAREMRNECLYKDNNGNVLNIAYDPDDFDAVTNEYNIKNAYGPNYHQFCKKIIYNKKRKIDVVNSALKSIVNQYHDKMYIGIQTLNNNKLIKYWGGSYQIVKGINNEISDQNHGDPFTSDVNLLDKTANDIAPKGFTPATTSYLAIASKVRNNLKYRCQKSFIVMMSDGDANAEEEFWGPYGRDPRDKGELYFPQGKPIGWGTRQFPGYDDTEPAGYAGSYRDYFGMVPYSKTPESQPGYGNPGAGYLIYNYNGPDGLAHFTGILHTKSIKNEGVDRAGKPWTDGGFAPQVITTYTVAFGTGVSPNGTAYLTNAAQKGGGKYLSAENEQKLNDAFSKIFNDIESNKSSYKVVKKYSTVAPTILAKPQGLKGAGDVQMATATFLDSGSWSSQIRFYPTDANGTVTDPTKYSVPDYSNRTAIIDLSDGKGGNKKVLPLPRIVNAGNPNSISNILNNQYFGITKNGNDQYEWAYTLLPWVSRLPTSRGFDNDQDINNFAQKSNYSIKYRIRPVSSKENPPSERDMGDVLDTPIVALGDYLVTGANDGMVYIFRKNLNGTTGQMDTDHPYKLVLNYIPAGLPNETGKLADIFQKQAKPEYGQADPHIYGINGGLVMRQTAPNNSGQSSMFAVGALGQGGRGLYGLNISALNRGKFPVEWAGTLPLFTYTDDNLGYVTTSPQIGFISERHTNGQVANYDNTERAIFFGNGYKAKGKPTLYILKMGNKNSLQNSGSLLRKITISNVPDGGLSEPALVDINGDGVVDLAYAGDTNGNMYRFDLRGDGIKDWNATMIYKGITSQPISSAPVIARLDTEYYTEQEIKDDSTLPTPQNLKDLSHATNLLPQKNIRYVVVFGTGSDIYQSDETNKSLQSVYGIFDYIKNPKGAINNQPVIKKNLLAQTWTCQSTEICNLSTNQFANTDKKATLPQKAQTQKGWYYDLNIDLNKPGERVVTRPILLLQTVFLTTRIYGHSDTVSNTGSDGDPCVAQQKSSSNAAQSRFIQANVRTGGKTDKYLFKGSPVKDAYVPLGKDDTAFSSKLYTSLFIPQYFTTSITPNKNKLPKECLLPTKTKARQLFDQKNPNLCDQLMKRLTCISGKSPTDVGGSGQECLPTDKLILESNAGCFDADSAHKHFLTGVNTDTGLIKPYQIRGGQCPDIRNPTGFGVKRISWRELF